MTYTPPDYHTARPIGTGRSNPADVRRTRSALKRAGYGSFPTPGAPNVTPGLMEAVERFQRDFGLKPDAVIEPGGPTERALSMALHARSAEGEAGMGRLRDGFIRRAKAGQTFRPHPRDRNAGQWTDGQGRVLADAQTDTATARRRTRLAMMTRRERLRKPYELDTEGSGPFRPSRGYLGAGDTLRALGHAIFHGAPAKEAADGVPNGRPRGSERTMPLRNPDIRTPPSPAHPPAETEQKEEYPAEERKPSVTVSPVQEERKPQIEIFPDLRDALEQWLIVENSRGLEHLQQKDVQQIIDRLSERMNSGKFPFRIKHIGGGHTAPNKRGEREYKKERVVRRDDSWPAPHGRPDISVEVDGEHEDINVIDTWKDRQTPTAREARNAAKLDSFKRALEQMRPMRLIPKSRGFSDEEYDKLIDAFLDDLFEEWTKIHNEQNRRQ